MDPSQDAAGAPYTSFGGDDVESPGSGGGGGGGGAGGGGGGPRLTATVHSMALEATSVRTTEMLVEDLDDVAQSF